MKLYMLMAGRSKKRMKHIATDELHKIENYRDARVKTAESGQNKVKWFEIFPAPEGAEVWRKTNSMSKMWKSQDNADRGILPRSK